MRVLDDIPSLLHRPALTLACAVAAFFLMAGVGFATAQLIARDSSAEAPRTPTAAAGPGALSVDPTFPWISEPVTATTLPDRTECSEIEGTDYRSEAERAYYQENCAVGAASIGSSGPVSTGGLQSPLGDRLVIPSIGVNADVYGTVVGPDGVMVDPVGYFNVVRYDFLNHVGLGGSPEGGNMIIAGHVDSAIYGAVVFYNLTDLQAGAVIEYYTAAGQVVRYEVTGAGSYLPSDDWAGIVSAGAADLTLITCTGSFNTSAAGEYSHRHAVFGRRL